MANRESITRAKLASGNVKNERWKIIGATITQIGCLTVGVLAMYLGFQPVAITYGVGIGIFLIVRAITRFIE